MPNCIIMGCPHKTGNNQKFPGIVLHSFPSSLDRIKKWILQTGQVFQDPDALANKIYEGKKTDTFRMCSAHFTKDSYIFTAQKRFLKHNALPAVFPQPTEGKPLIDEQKIVGKRKKKSERVEAKNISSFICGRCLMSENIYEGKVLVDAGTQTDSNVPNQPQKPPPAPVLPVTQAVLMLSVPLQSYCTQQLTPIIKQPTQALGGHSIIGYNPQDLLKNAHATTSQSFPLMERCGLQLPPSSDHSKGYGSTGDGGSKCAATRPVGAQEDVESRPLPDVVRGRRLLVFEDCLDSLVTMVKCRDASGCTKVVKRFNKEYRGSAVVVRGQCEDGHFFKIWESQPRVKRFFAGNVLMAASLFCSGLGYREVHGFFGSLGLRHISEKKYNYFRQRCCYPAIRAAWEEERKDVTRGLRDRPVFLAGEGRRVDAERSVYTLCDTITDKIVDFEIVPSRSTVDTERRGLEACMSRVIAAGADVACFASDRRRAVVESMKENYERVEHQFDVRLYAKGLFWKLKAAGWSKFCAALRPWTKKIYKHFLWSVQTCENNEDLLREKWLSVLHHVANAHSWEEGRLYKQCDHDDLSLKTLRETLWLKPGSPAFRKVEEIVTDPRLLGDLKRLTWNCRSGVSASFNGGLVRSVNGSPQSGAEEIEARVKLAALDHNRNVGRRKARVPGGKDTWDDTARRKGSAGRCKRLLRPTREPYDYLWPVMEGVLGNCEDKSSYESRAPSVPPSFTESEKPGRADAGPVCRLGFKKRKSEN